MPKELHTLLDEAQSAGLPLADLAKRARVDRHQLEDSPNGPRLTARERWRVETALWEHRADRLVRAGDVKQCRWMTQNTPTHGRKGALAVAEHMQSCPECRALDEFLTDQLGPLPHHPPPVATLWIDKLFGWLPYDAQLGSRLLIGVGRGLVWAMGLTVLVGVLWPLEMVRTNGEIGIQFGPLVIFYFQGGIIGAGLFYAMRPLHKSLPGILFAGWVTGATLLFMLISSFDHDLAFADRMFESMMFSTGAGPLIGLFQWWRDQRHR